MSANAAIFNPTESTSAATGDGFSVPRLTTTGRLAISFGTADKGMMVYDTTLNNLFIWNGSAWESVPASGDAGANGDVQYNDNGIIAGATGFSYAKATGAVSITGDLTVDTSTLKVDSANDRVGIGTAAPSQFVHLSKSNTSTALTAPPAGGASLRIQNTSSTTNNFGSVEFYNAAGLFGASINCQYTNQSTPTNDLVFVVRGSSGGLEAARIDSSGNLGLGVTPSAGAGVLQLSSGINFPATQVASANANTLDDYEEGTWTPTVKGSSSAGTGTYSVQVGTYTKIGRVVHYQARVTWSAHTGSGEMRFGALPFNSLSTTNSFNACIFGYVNNVTLTASNVMTGAVAPGTNDIQLFQTPVGGGAASSVTLDTAADIIVSGTYYV